MYYIDAPDTAVVMQVVVHGPIETRKEQQWR